jgi:hypothetical protein
MRLALFVTLLAVLQASPAPAARQAAGPPACFGDVATVRVSQIKPGGTIQGFQKAVAAHLAWYRANGIKDNDIVAARVFVRDEKTGAPIRYSDTEMLSLHFRPPDAERTPNKNDPAWQAFVKQYRDNSDLKVEYLACIPKVSR